MGDNARGYETGLVGADLPGLDRGSWHCETEIRKYDGDWTPEQIDAGLAGEPFEIFHNERNALVNAGILVMLKAMRGDAPTYFSNANACIGVGDSSSSVTSAQTDLQGTLASGVTITGATNATPIVITAAAHGYNNGDTVTITGVSGNTSANGTWVIANKTTDTFELVGSIGIGAYTSGGTVQKGNRFRQHMDSTYPKVGVADGLADNQIQFRATFTSAQANWAWNEWGVFNAFVGGSMLNRSISAQGTKASPATWTFSILITIS